MQLFKPVSSSLSGGVFPHLFMWRPLIMNETEVSEESEERWWYRAKGRRGGGTGIVHLLEEEIERRSCSAAYPTVLCDELIIIP